MEVGFLSALSALAGSVVGGLTTGLTTWMALRAQIRAGHSAHEIARLEELFRDFIVTASRAYGKALVSSDPELQDLVALYAMIGRMRVLCSPQIVACADELMHLILETYFAPNHSFRELHELMKTGLVLDPLKKFSELARGELQGSAALLP